LNQDIEVLQGVVFTCNRENSRYTGPFFCFAFIHIQLEMRFAAR